ncbi:MAG: 30S ribosomal protein S11 [Patescibacteria group bacterium]
MGKKRIVKNEQESAEKSAETKTATEISGKKRLEAGILHVQSTYNNTVLVLTDKKGNVVASASSGSLGFKGAKKGTPFAAAKVGETLALKAQTLGVKEVSVVVKGVGSGRESGIRGFISKGINITSIKDVTPMPHNGPKPKKPRRV